MGFKKVWDKLTRSVVQVDENDDRMALDQDMIDALSPPTPAPGEKAPKRDRNAEVQEIIRDVARNKHLGVTLNEAWLEEGISPHEYRGRMLEELATKGRAQTAEEQVRKAYPAEELAGYSLARIIRMAAGMKGMDDGFGIRPSGIESEIDKGIRKMLPDGFPSHGGMLVPMRLFPAKPGERGSRAMFSNVAGSGAELVFDRPGDLIEYYRNASTLLRAGARNLQGLVGPVVFPKKTGGITFYWTAEGAAAVTKSSPTLGLVTMSPKPIMGSTEYHRSLVHQAPSAGVDLENMIREDAGEGMGLAIDLAGYHGSGVAGQPLGIFNAADVLTVTGMAATRAKTLEFLTKIAGQNVPTRGIAWVTTPEFAGALMAVQEAPNASSRFLWDGTIEEGTVAGYRAFSTNQISKLLGTGAQHGIVAGNFREAMVGGWGVVEVVVNPYSLDDQGQIRVTFYNMTDVAIRHGQGFCTSVMTV